MNRELVINVMRDHRISVCNQTLIYMPCISYKYDKNFLNIVCSKCGQNSLLNYYENVNKNTGIVCRKCKEELCKEEL